MHQIYFTVLGNVYLLLHKRLGKIVKPHAKRFPTQFLPHKRGGSECIGWLESTEINTAEVIPQIRKHTSERYVGFLLFGHYI